MNSLLPIAILTLGSAVSYGMPISVTCAAPTRSAVTSDSSTSASCTSLTNGSSYSGGGASATANVALQLAANGADFSSLTTYQSAYAQQAPRQANSLFGAAAQSSVAVSYSSTLTTSGSVRSGYLQIQGYGNGSNFYDGGATMTSGIVLASGSFYPTEITCSSNSSYCTPGTGYYNVFSLIPVTLGTTFSIEANGGTTNWAAGFDGMSGGSLNTVFNFRFLEADGRTPVNVSQVPEPMTLGLVGSALCSVAFLKKKRSQP
jgi:hypothetical protein